MKKRAAHAGRIARYVSFVPYLRCNLVHPVRQLWPRVFIRPPVSVGTNWRNSQYKICPKCTMCKNCRFDVNCVYYDLCLQGCRFATTMGCSGGCDFGTHYCEKTCYTNPTMHQSHIPQYTIQMINVHTSSLNGTFWDMWDVNLWIYEFGLFCFVLKWPLKGLEVCWQDSRCLVGQLLWYSFNS